MPLAGYNCTRNLLHIYTIGKIGFCPYLKKTTFCNTFEFLAKLEVI